MPGPILNLEALPCVLGQDPQKQSLVKVMSQRVLPGKGE